MRAAHQRQRRGAIGQGQGQQHRLKDQAHRPGAAPFGGQGHVKGVLARLGRRAGRKGERLRIQLVPLYLRAAHLGRGAYRRQVLGL